MSDTSINKQARISDIFAKCLIGLATIAFLIWLASGLEGSFKDAPHYLLVYYTFTFLVAVLIRKRAPRASGIIGFLFSLLYCFFVFTITYGSDGLNWYDYMVTFVGGPLALLILGLSVRMITKK
jgi:hypothetical protein